MSVPTFYPYRSLALALSFFLSYISFSVSLQALDNMVRSRNNSSLTLFSFKRPVFDKNATRGVKPISTVAVTPAASLAVVGWCAHVAGRMHDCRGIGVQAGCDWDSPSLEELSYTTQSL